VRPTVNALVTAATVIACATLVACDRPSPDADVEPIDIFGPYRGVEADRFAASLESFERSTGIDVNYTGSADFVSDLRQRAESGQDAPDIAIVPQPGVITDLVERDLVVELSDGTLSAIAENYGARADVLTEGGAGYVAPYRISPKSLVWYRPDVFAEYGLEVPTTFDEFVELVDRIDTGVGSADHEIAPWCFTMASGSATGWAATDWAEDVVLHQAGVDSYDAWTSGSLPWNDPSIRRALTTFDELVVAVGQSAGGLRSILQVDVSEASEPMFGELPGCAMYKQASFAEAWFPDDIVVGEDIDFFVMPGTDRTERSPVLVGADGLVQFSDDPRIDELMTYLVSPEGGQAWAERGGYLSARTSVDLATYYTDTERRIAEVLLDGRELRFDASDLMHPDLGSGLLWDEITTWVSGTSTLDSFVTTIDDAIAASREP
jgi:alpha-glucoside transport system substrate-binding protein